ncbi:MAG: hypothetical protein V4546_04585 [Bacteroidota bacterium]
MKKLFFIIPKVLLSLFFFLFSASNLYADTPIYGCRVGLRIWTDPDIYHHSGSPYFINDIDENGTDDSFSNNAGRCGAGATTPCYVINKIDGSYRHTSMGLPVAGVLDYYSIDNCPIDNYIPLLFIFTIGITLIKFKKVVPL